MRDTIKIPESVICTVCKKLKTFKGNFEKLAGGWGKVAKIECECKGGEN